MHQPLTFFSCLSKKVCAALAELTVPHFATKCIFTAAKEGATAASYTGYLKLLAVRMRKSIVRNFVTFLSMIGPLLPPFAGFRQGLWVGRICRLLLDSARSMGGPHLSPFAGFRQGLWVGRICRLLLIFGKVYGWAASAAFCWFLARSMGGRHLPPFTGFWQGLWVGRICRLHRILRAVCSESVKRDMMCQFS